MKRITKILVAALLAFLLLPVLAFVAYDALVFQPCMREMRGILAQADPEDRNPPPLVRRYILVSHQTGNLCPHW